ncbi:long-chain-fatty-acid--CoA ligase [Laceyella putida]|uniref:Long-chain fatty acid--CoA ligase n=1 Tax=Laceyella putida TaxID=110101 RepID=A0ABW2RJF8_9BACL
MEERPWVRFYPPGVPKEIEFPSISLHQLLVRSANDYPENTAIIDGDQMITFRQVKEWSENLAANLLRMGFQKGQRMAIMLPNGWEYVVSYYAIQRLGGVVVQVNPMYQQQELEGILDDSMAWGIIGHHEIKDKLSGISFVQDIAKIFIYPKQSESVECSFMEMLADQGHPLPDLDINPREDIAVLQYTGGTTGRSKGVMLTHYNLISNLYQNFSIYRGVLKRPGEKLLGISPFFHVYGMNNCMNFSIFTAATIICVKKFDPDHVMELIQKHRPTFFPGVPTMYIALLHHPLAQEIGLNSIKVCSSGSAPMPVEVMEELEQKTGAFIIEGYGLSEASPSTHRNPICGKRKIGSIGIPIPGTDSKVVDLDMGTIEQPPGVPGELIVKGPQVMKGYWNNPEETRLVLRDGWLYTGDIAMMDEEGYFTIVGRKKEMIISGGFNIYPNEVEEVLYQHSAIKEVCAFGVPDSYRGEVVKIAVVLRRNRQATAQELMQWCGERLAPYKVPQYVEFVDELPKSTVGKVLRRKVAEAYGKKGYVDKQKS